MIHGWNILEKAISGFHPSGAQRLLLGWAFPHSAQICALVPASTDVSLVRCKSVSGPSNMATTSQLLKTLKQIERDN